MAENVETRPEAPEGDEEEEVTGTIEFQWSLEKWELAGLTPRMLFIKILDDICCHPETYYKTINVSFDL